MLECIRLCISEPLLAIMNAGKGNERSQQAMLQGLSSLRRIRLRFNPASRLERQGSLLDHHPDLPLPRPFHLDITQCTRLRQRT